MSLYEETVELIPYSEVLTWWLQQIATNPEMTILLEKLGVTTSLNEKNQPMIYFFFRRIRRRRS